MKIMLLAPVWETVPPPAYGGIEVVVHLLAEGLVKRGHKVTLFASGDSITCAELRWIFPRSLGSTYSGMHAAETLAIVHVAAALQQAEDFDIIHNHAGEAAMLMAPLAQIPMLTTMHLPALPEHEIIFQFYPGFFNTISKRAKVGYPDRGYLGVVYNAVDVASFPFSEEKGDYLLFLSRISPEKGTHIAIEVARRLGKKLIMAGKVDLADEQYFERDIRPQIDGKLIQFLGEADAKMKRELYAKASCLLLPLLWEEPFGLVIAEAMACGTPVIAFSRGAAPELIVDGKTGYLVRDLDEMMEAVRRLDLIEPRHCREHVAQNFGVGQMVDGYLNLYKEILTAAISGHLSLRVSSNHVTRRPGPVQ